VNSTFGESRNYWLSPQNQQPGRSALHYRCPKTMHVSPFMDMNLDYEFVLTEPGEKLVAHMNTIDARPGIRIPRALSLMRRSRWNISPGPRETLAASCCAIPG
jgi:DUF1365 family protein